MGAAEELKSQGNQTGSACFPALCPAQICYISPHVSQIRLLACFLHGHNGQRVLLSDWHVDRGESQETADDEGLCLGRGNGADWAALYQVWAEELRFSTYQEPDARGEKSPPLTGQKYFTINPKFTL